MNSYIKSRVRGWAGGSRKEKISPTVIISKYYPTTDVNGLFQCSVKSVIFKCYRSEAMARWLQSHDPCDLASKDCLLFSSMIYKQILKMDSCLSSHVLKEMA